MTDQTTDAFDHIAAGHGLDDFRPVTEPVAGPDGWEPPLPLGWQTDLPEFPVDALPPVVAGYVAGLATELQVPVDLPGVVALGMLSACSGGRVNVQVRRGWVEPTNLWVVPVLRPGSLKSAVIQKGRKPIAEAEARLVEEDRESIIRARAEQKILLDHAEALQKSAAKDPTAENIKAAQEAAIAADNVVVPEWPRLLASDMTPERMVGLLASGGGRIAAVSAEAGIFTSLTGRHSKLPNLDPALQAHAGDAIRVDRVGREPEQVENPALTLIASIQPFALTEMTSRPDFAGRGLLARVLWSLPKDNIGYRDIDAPAMHPTVQQAYETLICELAYTMAATEPFVVELDHAAGTRFREYRKTVEARLRPDGPLGGNTAREWGSKLCGAVLRIAGALHVASPSRSDPISEATLAAATRLGDYFQAHALAAFSAGDDSKGESANARTVLKVLIEKEMITFKVRELQRRVPRHLQKSAVLTGILESLTELGWVRPVELGGYELHPSAASEFASSPADSADNADSSPISAGQTTYDHPPSVVSTPDDNADEIGEHAVTVSTVSMGADNITPHPAPGVTCENTDPVSVVSTVSRGSATNQHPAIPGGPVVSGLRQQAHANLTRGRRDPQPDEPDHDPSQGTLLSDDTEACRACGAPAKAWILASRDGRCITCAQHARKEAS